MITVACVNAGDYLGRGKEYVTKLASSRNRGLPFVCRLVCFTDDGDAYGGLVETRPLPHPGLIGWMNKIALFKPGVFEHGERVLYLDLDTVITGSLADIASYAGEFALLDDLMFAGQWGSGVMAWRGGFGAHIFQSYLDAGCPDVPGGDQAWIRRTVARADLLQDLYPNQIASYKMSGGVLAPQTRICCFHGVPRPHDITTGWVPHFWSHKDPA
jgi:hypothetical protein